MGTFDIGLALRKKPIFPDICVACEKPNPGHTMEISVLGADTGSLTENVVDGLLDTSVGSAASNNKTKRIKGITVCKGCESKLKWYHRLLKLATYTIWLPALGLFLVMPGPMVVRVILFIAIIIAPPILSMIFPPAFGATILNGNANYEFRSKVVADEFMKLNVDAAAVIKEAEKSELQTE
jgi:hypothetical protein